MKTVSIHQCSGPRRTWETTHRTDDEDVAIRRAITKRWGKKAWFWQDTSLKEIGRFGQIMEPFDQNSHTALTYQVRIDVSEGR